MGQFVSALVGGIQAVANDITKLVTDVGTTVTQLSGVTAGLTPPALHAFMAVNDGGGNVNTAINGAVTAAKTAASTLLKSQFPADTAAGSDSGVVANYKDGGSVQSVISQMSQDFGNWDLDVDTATMNAMAATIQQEISAQMGKAGSAYGTHYLNQNQYYDWAVAYGLFQIAADNQGLVYGFTIAFNSGWGK